jgi:hypothetical protein
LKTEPTEYLGAHVGEYWIADFKAEDTNLISARSDCFGSEGIEQSNGICTCRRSIEPPNVDIVDVALETRISSSSPGLAKVSGLFAT